jgi:hypothetical protein
MGVTWVIASPEHELKRIVEDRIYLERSLVAFLCPISNLDPAAPGKG